MGAKKSVFGKFYGPRLKKFRDGQSKIFFYKNQLLRWFYVFQTCFYAIFAII